MDSSPGSICRSNLVKSPQILLGIWWMELRGWEVRWGVCRATVVCNHSCRWASLSPQSNRRARLLVPRRLRLECLWCHRRPAKPGETRSIRPLRSGTQNTIFTLGLIHHSTFLSFPFRNRVAPSTHAFPLCRRISPSPLWSLCTV